MCLRCEICDDTSLDNPEITRLYPHGNKRVCRACHTVIVDTIMDYEVDDDEEQESAVIGASTVRVSRVLIE